MFDIESYDHEFEKQKTFKMQDKYSNMITNLENEVKRLVENIQSKDENIK